MIHKNNILSNKTITLLQELSGVLQEGSKGKLSTNEISPDRLLWEIYNKIFTVLVTLENCIVSKDSLASHLVARYTYELSIIFAYIFQDKTETIERAKKFLEFNQFQSLERKWTKVEYTQMIDSLPNKSRFTLHKDHYRRLSNFAHPTMDSFLLNRRGSDSEFLMILNVVLLTIGTIVELVKITIEDDLYFAQDSDFKNQISKISISADQLMKELQGVIKIL